MLAWINNLSVRRLQIIGWVALYLINILIWFPSVSAVRAVSNASISVVFYLVIVYGNVSFLIPRFWLRSRYAYYFFWLSAFFAITVVSRMWIHHQVLSGVFGDTKFDYSARQWTLSFLTNFLILVISYLFYAATAYLHLLRRNAEVETQSLKSELILLKSQVQPHFIFNTLNNIYYEAYSGSAETAPLIAKLSSLMRYFVDESPKELVELKAELEFIRNYIALECIRLRHKFELNFQAADLEGVQLPPMLLIPFVENLFKHGIDKTVPGQSGDIILKRENGKLICVVVNNWVSVTENMRKGVGLKNLHQRLTLLYGSNFELVVAPKDGKFIARMAIPIS